MLVAKTTFQVPLVKAASEQATTTCDLAADSLIATSTGDSETVPSYIEENGEVIWTLAENKYYSADFTATIATPGNLHTQHRK